MLKSLALASALLCVFTINAEARQRHKTYAAHERCNIDWPCEGVTASPRGERVVKAMGGLGSARKVYTPRASATKTTKNIPQIIPERAFYRGSEPRQRIAGISPAIVAHPLGCPRSAFCGCGAAVRVFGSPIRSLWLAANWFKFPRSQPSAGMVAVRRHHVFVLERHLGGNTWIAFDANSGGHRTRIHARSIAGYVIVNPRA